MKILPQYIFNSRDPIVIGVTVEAGQVKQGTPMCVPSKNVSSYLKQAGVNLCLTVDTVCSPRWYHFSNVCIPHSCPVLAYTLGGDVEEASSNVLGTL